VEFEPPQYSKEAHFCPNATPTQLDLQCYNPDHGCSACKKQGELELPTPFDAAATFAAANAVILGVPDPVCQPVREYLEVSWAFLVQNLDIVEWIFCMLEHTFPDHIDASDAFALLENRLLTDATFTWVFWLESDRSDACDSPAHAGFGNPFGNPLDDRVPWPQEWRELHDNPSAGFYDPLTGGLDPRGGLFTRPNEAYVVFDRHERCKAGRASERQSASGVAWRILVEAYRWGSPGEKLCAVTWASTTLLHELLHLTGFSSTSHGGYHPDWDGDPWYSWPAWTEELGLMESANPLLQHGTAGDCDFHWLLGRTFRWAISQRYPGADQGCCAGHGMDNKFMMDCTVQVPAGPCIHDHVSIIKAHQFGECGSDPSPEVLSSQPASNPVGGP
jgi:hypothetical protein